MKIIAILLLATSGLIAQDVIPEWAVRVYTHNDTNDQFDSVGSGSLISPNLVLTANHVTRFAIPGNSIEIRFSDGKRIRGMVIANDNNADASIVQLVRHTTKTPVGVAEMITEGVGIKSAGFGTDYEFVWNHGKYEKRLQLLLMPSDTGVWLNWRDDPEGDYVLFSDMTSRHGDSGCAAIQNGLLVGIVTSTNAKTRKTTVQRIDTIRKVFAKFF